MPCYVITCHGWGSDIWFFADEESAIHHPCTQSGDAVIVEPMDLWLGYRFEEIPLLLRLLDLPVLAGQAEDLLPRMNFLPEKESFAKSLFSHALVRLAEMARPPPRDPVEIVETLRRHRDFSVRILKFRRKAKHMTAMSETVNESVTEDEPNTVAPKTPRTGRLDPKARILFGANKDGAKYNTDGNAPYRSDSSRALRWSQLVEGMTVQEVCAIEGYTAATLEREINEGKIVLTA